MAAIIIHVSVDQIDLNSGVMSIIGTRSIVKLSTSSFLLSLLYFVFLLFTSLFYHFTVKLRFEGVETYCARVQWLRSCVG